MINTLLLILYELKNVTVVTQIGRMEIVTHPVPQNVLPKVFRTEISSSSKVYLTTKCKSRGFYLSRGVSRNLRETESPRDNNRGRTTDEPQSSTCYEAKFRTELRDLELAKQDTRHLYVSH